MKLTIALLSKLQLESLRDACAYCRNSHEGAILLAVDTNDNLTMIC